MLLLLLLHHFTQHVSKYTDTHNVAALPPLPHPHPHPQQHTSPGCHCCLHRRHIYSTLYWQQPVSQSAVLSYSCKPPAAETTEENALRRLQAAAAAAPAPEGTMAALAVASAKLLCHAACATQLLIHAGCRWPRVTVCQGEDGAVHKSCYSCQLISFATGVVLTMTQTSVRFSNQHINLVAKRLQL